MNSAPRNATLAEALYRNIDKNDYLKEIYGDLLFNYSINLNSRVYFITVLGLLTHHSMYRPITAVFFIPSGVEICIRSSYNLPIQL